MFSKNKSPLWGFVRLVLIKPSLANISDFGKHADHYNESNVWNTEDYEKRDSEFVRTLILRSALAISEPEHEETERQIRN